MLQVLWRASARANLVSIIQAVATQNPGAARRLREVIEASVLPAAEHPYLYRTGRVAGTREIIAHPNYIVVYKVMANHIEVVNVFHARQEYP